MSIPNAANLAFHANIVPTPLYNETFGVHYGPCNSTVPDLGVVIGGVEFKIKGDTIMRFNPLTVGIEAPEGYCASVIGPSVTGDSRLYMGDIFFWSVMVTKDYKSETLTFTQIE